MAKKLKHIILDKRIEIWGKNTIKNELNEIDCAEEKIKEVWSSITPQTGSIKKAQAGTFFADVTTKITIRYSAFKELKNDNWIIFKGHRFDIKYILNPFFKNETLEIFCSEVIE